MPAAPAEAVVSAALEIQGLRFSYPGALQLSIDSLRLGPGEQALLGGASGAGKSTLLNLVAGLLDPAAGAVRIAGQAIHERRGAARDLFRGRHLGMIFQTFNLLPGFSALENVMLALAAAGKGASEQRARAAELLRTLGIERPDASPEDLSVGQQQRVAVARAIACRPTLVLADEPTASLDPPTAAAAMDLIQQACRDCGAALLCTSHDPAMASRFGRVESIERFLAAPAAGVRS